MNRAALYNELFKYNIHWTPRNFTGLVATKGLHILQILWRKGMATLSLFQSVRKLRFRYPSINTNFQGLEAKWYVLLSLTLHLLCSSLLLR
ncbi:hypothetical protein GJ496_002316 [Pomphorhynchus laevis]|nr:hypothetical protein GJ496_002316 [Pomphorhynchus laevis]